MEAFGYLVTTIVIIVLIFGMVSLNKKQKEIESERYADPPKVTVEAKKPDTGQVVKPPKPAQQYVSLYNWHGTLEKRTCAHCDAENETYARVCQVCGEQL